MINFTRGQTTQPIHLLLIGFLPCFLPPLALFSQKLIHLSHLSLLSLLTVLACSVCPRSQGRENNQTINQFSPLLSSWIPTLAKPLFHHLPLASGLRPLSLVSCPQAPSQLLSTLCISLLLIASLGHLMVEFLPHWSSTIFGLTCVTEISTSWLSGILGLALVTVIYCLPSGIARPSNAPELGPSLFHWLFEHSLPELVQNEWNATVIGGKGSSLWSRNRGLSSLSLPSASPKITP